MQNIMLYPIYHCSIIYKNEFKITSIFKFFQHFSVNDNDVIRGRTIHISEKLQNFEHIIQLDVQTVRYNC